MTQVFYVGNNGETFGATVTDNDWGVLLNIQITKSDQIIHIAVPFIDASDIVMKLRTMLGENAIVAEIKEEEKKDANTTTEGGIARY